MRLHPITIGILAALLSSACTAPKRAEVCRKQTAPSRPNPRGPLELEMQLFRELKRATSGNPTSQGTIAVKAGAPGDRIEGLFGVSPSDCALLIAKSGHTVSDLDLYAYGDDGALLGLDETEGADATVLVCPPHPRRLFVSARVVTGHGLVAVGGHAFPADAEPAVRDKVKFGASEPISLDDDERWPELAERLATHRASLGGAWQTISRQVLPADSRIPTHVSLSIRKDRCIDVLVAPDQRVGHLSLEIFNIQGQVLGRGLGSGRYRSAVVCSPMQTTVSLGIRPHGGRGLVALIVSRSLDEGETALDIPSLRLDAAPMGTVDEERQKLAERLESRGLDAAPNHRAVSKVSLSRHKRLPMDLEPGCHRLDILAGRPFRGLRANLWTLNGELLAEAEGIPPLALITCTSGGSVVAELESLAVPGRVAVELRTVREGPIALRRSPLAASRLLSRMLARGVIRSIRQITKVESIQIESSSTQRMPLTLPVSRCVDATLAAERRGAHGVELRLVNESTGEELALSRGANSAAARACALERPEAIPLVAEVRAIAGSGRALFSTRLLAPKP